MTDCGSHIIRYNFNTARSKYKGTGAGADVKNRMKYDAIMARIDELFFATDENTPKDDKRLLELDVLSAMVEEYEQELDIDPSIVLAL